MPEAGGDEGAEVFGLHFAGDGERQTLPGVAWALDDFDRVVHERAEVDRRGYQRTGRSGGLAVRGNCACGAFCWVRFLWSLTFGVAGDLT